MKLSIRRALPSDSEVTCSVAASWWGRPIDSDMVSRSFLTHFSETCLIAETHYQMVGFLIGFLSQTHTNEAYIRLVVVNPQNRGAGVGRALYEAFFKVASRHQRGIVRSVTSPSNEASVAFHKCMGFSIEPQEHSVNGLPVRRNYHGREGTDRVVFVKEIE